VGTGAQVCRVAPPKGISWEKPQQLGVYLLSPSPSLPPSQAGRFLGEVDGALMTQLLSMGVFSQ
jgi:hypothetical protein